MADHAKCVKILCLSRSRKRSLNYFILFLQTKLFYSVLKMTDVEDIGVPILSKQIIDNVPSF